MCCGQGGSRQADPQTPPVDRPSWTVTYPDGVVAVKMSIIAAKLAAGRVPGATVTGNMITDTGSAL